MMDIGKDLQRAFDDGYAQGKQDAVKWIPVTERLPDFEGSLLCMRRTQLGLRVQDILYFEDGKFSYRFSYNGIDNLEYGAVTHWMPLPKPPKDGEA